MSLSVLRRDGNLGMRFCTMIGSTLYNMEGLFSFVPTVGDSASKISSGGEAVCSAVMPLADS